MNIVCLDMEGVLVPEIWIAFAEESGIPELKRTTRDEPDYDKLMKWRLEILKEHGLGLKEIQASKAGFLFKSTQAIRADHPELPAFEEFGELLEAIKGAIG